MLTEVDFIKCSTLLCDKNVEITHKTIVKIVVLYGYAYVWRCVNFHLCFNYIHMG